MPKKRHNPALLRSCVADYLDTGNLAEAARRNGLDTSLLPQWRKRPDWHQVEAEMVATIDSEAKASFRRTLTKAIKHTEERLDQGDVTVLKGVPGQGSGL